MPFMDKKYRCTPFAPQDSRHRQVVANIWNKACGPNLAFTPEFDRFNTLVVSGVEQHGQMVFYADQPVGFALASYEMGNPSPLLSSLMNHGWIDAISVLPDHARKGIGSDLFNWAQTWLVSKGCKLIHLGGSIRPFAPGLPVELGIQDFFLKLGFKDNGTVWDVTHDLQGYQPGQYSRLDCVRPLQPEQTEAMGDFLLKEFPDRWLFEFEEAVRKGDRLTDYRTLWVETEINGMVNLTFEDSPRPLARYYMARLSRPWGQLGTVGASHRLRGMGYGALMMDSSLSRL